MIVQDGSRWWQMVLVSITISLAIKSIIGVQCPFQYRSSSGRGGGARCNLTHNPLPLPESNPKVTIEWFLNWWPIDAWRPWGSWVTCLLDTPQEPAPITEHVQDRRRTTLHFYTINPSSHRVSIYILLWHRSIFFYPKISLPSTCSYTIQSC